MGCMPGILAWKLRVVSLPSCTLVWGGLVFNDLPHYPDGPHFFSGNISRECTRLQHKLDACRIWEP